MLGVYTIVFNFTWQYFSNKKSTVFYAMLFYKCVTSPVFYVIEKNLDKHKCSEYVKLFTTEICIELYKTPMYNYSQVQN